MQVHAPLTDARPTVAIPDLNGRHDRLTLALKYADPASHFLVFLGDLFDDGPGSARIFAQLRELHAQGGVQLLAGNHEEMMINALYGPPGKRRAINARVSDTPEWRLWLANGGQATLSAYRRRQTLEENVEWLRVNSKRWFTRSGWLYAHATRPAPEEGRPAQTLASDPLLWARPTNGHELKQLPAGIQGSVHGHTPCLIPQRLHDAEGKPAWFIDLGRTSANIAVHHSSNGVQVLRASEKKSARWPLGRLQR